MAYVTTTLLPRQTSPETYDSGLVLELANYWLEKGGLHAFEAANEIL